MRDFRAARFSCSSYFDPARATRIRAFDHNRLAAALTAALGRPMHGESLDIADLDFTTAGVLTLTVGQYVARCTTDSYRCTASDLDARVPGRSPDGKWVAFVRDFNLFVRDVASGQERQLTTDGTREYAYATGVANPGVMVAQGTSTPRGNVVAGWSPDSRRLLTIRMDVRHAGRLTMTQYAPPNDVRPRSYEYVYPLAIDSLLPREDLIVFTVDGWKRTDLQGGPIDHYYYGATQPRWTGDGSRLTLNTRARGYQGQSFIVWDAVTGAQRDAVTERGEPYFEVYGSSIVVPIQDAT